MHVACQWKVGCTLRIDGHNVPVKQFTVNVLPKDSTTDNIFFKFEINGNKKNKTDLMYHDKNFKSCDGNSIGKRASDASR